MKIKKFLCVVTTVIITAVSLVIPAEAATVIVDAPAKITASAKTETSVKVSWDAVKNADSYIVYYSTEKKDGYKSYGKTTKTTVTVKDLKTGTKYYFAVKAVKEVDGKKIKSKYSKVVYATPNTIDDYNNPITVIQKPGDVQNGHIATLKIKGKPNTSYYCVVYYKTVNGKAKGIGESLSNSEGIAEWTWKVGTTTIEGEHPIGIIINGVEIKFFNIFNTHRKSH